MRTTAAAGSHNFFLDWTRSYNENFPRQEKQLASQLERLWLRSGYFREIWSESGFDRMPTPPELRLLPLITKQDLRRALEQEGPLGSHLACDEADVSHIHATSGTSGRPTYFGLTDRDYEKWLEIFVRGFKVAGARRDDRVLQGFAMSRGYAGAVPMVTAFEQMGCVTLAIGAEAGSAILSDVIERQRPTLLYASPSMLRRLAVRFQEETGVSASDSSVKKVITGGEPGAGDSRSKQALSALWGAQVREAGGGSDICPLMWSECEIQDGLHFVAADEVLFELVDPDTARLKDVEDGVEGEIVYTHLRREANPLVRMRHGDIVHVETSPCACGLESPRIRFLGRSDDMVIVRGVKVFPSSVQALVSEFTPPLTGLVAVKKRFSDQHPLEIVCECAESLSDSGLESRIEDRARAMLGVKVVCSLVEPGSLGDHGQKTAWVIQEGEDDGE